MKKRFITFFGLQGLILLLLMAPAQGQFNGGMQASQGAGCGGGAFLDGGDTPPGGDTPGFLTGEPIDIPVSIAKAIDPVDSTQFRFQLSGSSPNLTTPFLQAQVSESLTIYGKTRQPLVTVAVYMESRLVSVLTSNVHSEFSYSTTSAVLNKTLCFVVRGERNQVSYPVCVTPLSTDSLFPEVRQRVHITNITGIPAQQMAASLDSVYYATQDVDGNSLLALSPILGGRPELVSDEPSSLLNGLEVSSDETFLLGLNDSNDVVRTEISNGALTDLLASSGEAKLSPDGLNIASETTNGGSHVVRLTRASNVSTTTLLLPTEGQVNSLDMAWVTDSTLLVIKAMNAGNYRAELYNLSSLVSGTLSSTTSLTPILLFTSARLIAHPSVNPNEDIGSSSQFSYECADGEGAIRLCLSDFSTQQEIVGATEGLTSISNSVWNAGGEVILVEGRSSSDTSRSIIAAYLVNSGETVFIDEGSQATRSSGNSSIMLYISKDITGENQISVLNLRTNTLTQDAFD